MKIEKIILDTNIFISAFFFGGTCKNLIENNLDFYSICFSQELVEEIVNKFEQFNATEKQLENFDIIFKNSTIYLLKTKIKACRDPRDDHLLELSQTAKAKFLISGDKDLLTLEKWKTTKIITPKQFLTDI